MRTRRSVIHSSPQTGFPALNAGDKKFQRCPVAPTAFQKKPSGENLDGLSNELGVDQRTQPQTVKSVSLHELTGH